MISIVLWFTRVLISEWLSITWTSSIAEQNPVRWFRHKCYLVLVWPMSIIASAKENRIRWKCHHGRFYNSYINTWLSRAYIIIEANGTQCLSQRYAYRKRLIILQHPVRKCTNVNVQQLVQILSMTTTNNRNYKNTRELICIIYIDAVPYNSYWWR